MDLSLLLRSLSSVCSWVLSLGCVMVLLDKCLCKWLEVMLNVGCCVFVFFEWVGDFFGVEVGWLEFIVMKILFIYDDFVFLNCD